MKLEEVRELRQEWEAIEATMERVRQLWESEDFPTVELVRELAEEVSGIASSMQAAVDKLDELPGADTFVDLNNAAGELASTINHIIDKAEELPTADDVRG
jgi:hypothetical protein